MTQEQFEELGITMNTWIPLCKMFSYVVLIPDSNLVCDTKNIQFFFDTESEVVFVRRLIPKFPFKDVEMQEEYKVSFSFDGENCEGFIIPGAPKDEDVGFFNEVLSFDIIQGFVS